MIMQLRIIVLMILVSCSVFAQKKSVRESDVPETVQKSFFAQYPDTKTRTWTTKNGDYEVDFYINFKKYEAKYDVDGTWKKTGMKIDKRDVPESVINAWKISEFGKWMLDDFEQIEIPDYKLLYLLKAVKGLSEMELLYTPTGELLKAKNKNMAEN